MARLVWRRAAAVILSGKIGENYQNVGRIVLFANIFSEMILVHYWAS